MFEQSQLERSAGDRRKPAGMILGFTLQAMLLGGALLVSLIFTEGVPRLRFDSSMIAPPKARGSYMPIEQPPRRVVRVNFMPRPAGLVTPPEIPLGVVILDQRQQVEPAEPFPYDSGFLPSSAGSDGGPSAFLFPDAEASRIIELPAPRPSAPPEHSCDPIRVGGDVAAARLIHRVQPVYSPLALQVRLQGTVKLEAIISESGEIANLRVISGHPLLIQAALEAVSQWRYQPTLLNGTSVAVITTVEVNFVLGRH